LGQCLGDRDARDKPGHDDWGKLDAILAGWRSAFMSNENPSPPKKKRPPAGYFDILKWSGLPGFWSYMIGAILLTSVIAIGGAWLLVRLGVQ
jgi:hypothetical protein